MGWSKRREAPKPPDRTLTAIVDSRGDNAECNTQGGVVRFENEFFEGAAFFAHQPPAGADAPSKHAEMLASRGLPLALWEIQIQGRFKVKPEGTAFVGFELWDGPMELGLLTRAICGTIIMFGTSLAKQRGVEIRCSFGSSKGDPPCLVFPLAGADRIFVSDEPVQLPIKGGGDLGVWRVDGAGEWANIDRASLTFEPGQYHTFLFASAIIDMNAWTVCGVPGIGCLDLEQFWNKQALHVVLFDDGPEAEKKRTGPSRRRNYFEMQFHAPVVAFSDETSGRGVGKVKEPLSPASDSTQASDSLCDQELFPDACMGHGRQISPEVGLSNQPEFSHASVRAPEAGTTKVESSNWMASSEIIREYADFIRL